jgi:uncharacterized membrane-anchored protein
LAPHFGVSATAFNISVDKTMGQFIVKQQQPGQAAKLRPTPCQAAARVMVLTSKQPERIERKPSRVLRFSNRKILLTGLVLLCAQIELFFGVRHHWQDLFTVLAFSTGWGFCPLLSYISVRRLGETGFTWPWIFSVLLSFASTALFAYAFYFLVNHAA